MSALSCIIVDDEFLAIKLLQEYTTKIPELEVKKTFTNPNAALEYLGENKVDILFLDIQMPYLSGFDLLAKLKNPPLVIFTTARHDFAVQAFDLDVLDYLVKPISLERFEKAFNRALEYSRYKNLEVSNASKDFIMIKTDYRIHKLMLADIEYIEGLNEYIKIFTKDKMYITLMAMKSLLAKLPPSQFVRIHKSYIVSKQSARSYSHQAVKLNNGKELPIGRAFKEDFLKSLMS